MFISKDYYRQHFYNVFVLDTYRRLSIGDLSPNSSTVLVDQNLRYATTPSTPSSQATSGTYAQVRRTTRQEEESAPNYSRLCRAHATVDLERQGSRNQISTHVTDRYEFAEIHNMETEGKTSIIRITHS